MQTPHLFSCRIFVPSSAKIFLGLTGLLVLQFQKASATQPVYEPFTDGGRTNGADTHDLAWYSLSAPGTVLSIVNDSVTGGIGMGNALKLTATSHSQGFVANLPSTVALNDGDTLKLIFRWRFTGTTNVNQAARLRFGFFNNGGTPTAMDNDTTIRNNDVGYFGHTNPGLASTTGTGISQESSGSEILGGAGSSGVGGTGESINAGTAAQTAYLTLKRAGSGLLIYCKINDGDDAQATVTAPLTLSFNSVAISIGIGNYTTPSPLIVDQILVDYFGAETVGGGSIASPAAGPSATYGVGGAGYTLVKNWNFGSNGTVRNMTEMNTHFQYHDQFNQYNNGNGNYGAHTVAPDAANAINGQPVEGTATGGQAVRQFQTDSLKTYLVPLNGAVTVTPSLHNAGCGSFVAKWELPNGGSLLGKDVVWETRVRYVTPKYFWFSIWTAGNLWNQGAEIDLVESFGYDNGGGYTNFDGRYWHSDSVGGTDNVNYSSWSSAMASRGITSYNATQYHIWTLVYRKDNTFSCYVDGIEVQYGTINWTYTGVAGGTPIDMTFLFDGAWAHTKVTGVNYSMPASEFTGKYYEWDYSRVYLR